jgi:flagellar hook-associated protein 1 FlgK
MSSLSIGLSGLLTSQQLIDITGQNVANANTPSYHREVADLAPVEEAGTSIGDGVDLTSVTRVINQSLDDAINANTSSDSAAGAQLTGLNQLQTLLAPGTGSLDSALSNFFNTAQTLSANPDDLTERQVFLSSASDMTNGLNEASNGIDQLSASQVTQAQSSIAQVNTLTAQIAQLNQQIYAATGAGQSANQLLDQRDGAISSLSQLVDVSTIPQSDGTLNVLSGGSPLVVGTTATTLAADVNGQNQLYIHAADSQQALGITGGSLGGALTLYNTTLPAVQTQLNTLAQSLATQVNSVQATGVGLSGPMTSLASQQAVTSTTVPLADAKLPYPPTAGDLYVTVTNLSTGQKTLNKVSIDPMTQSLANVATALSAIPNLQAVVNPQDGSLDLIAQPGYGFDFTGNFSSSPDTQTITGTTTPTFDGQYTGSGNDPLTYTFTGSGTIGVTPNLTLNVSNSAGTLLTSLNVGQGYQAGTDLAGPLGVNVNLAAGTANAGDTFSLNVTANPDSSGLLPALGLNSFFVGSGAGGLAVNPNLIANPQNLALGTTNEAGDGSNLAKLVALGNQPTLNGQTQTFQKYLEGIIGNVGTQTQDMQTSQTAYDSLGQQLSAQQQSISGVDQNQELMNLVQYQQSYQLSAQYVSTVTQAFNDFLNLFAAPINP